MTGADLDAIEARAKAALHLSTCLPAGDGGCDKRCPVDDVPALVAEVRRLRSALEAIETHGSACGDDYSACSCGLDCGEMAAQALTEASCTPSKS